MLEGRTPGGGAEIHALFAGAPSTTEFRKLRKRIVRLEAKSFGRRQILFRALTQATPSHLLDPALFVFEGL